jgi:DNA replication and repair protein RecF
MQIRHLSLTNFRNFIRLEVEFSDGPTVFVGANAQGKTSLLEAIYYLTGAGSPHTSTDRQLVNFLSTEEALPFARLVAEIQHLERLHRVEVRILLEDSPLEGSQRTKKEVLINGIKRRVSDLGSVFNAVIFLPQDMRVIEGPPGERRRLLDVALSQADPTYAEAAREFGKALTQRNALLKSLQEGNGDANQLEFWDQQLCGHAATMIRARTLALHEMEQQAIPIHLSLTRDQEQLRLDYQPSYDPVANDEAQFDLPLDAPTDRTGIGHEAIRSGMLATLDRTRAEEIVRGMTLIGPHRDDFAFRVNGLDMRSFGSRGQNRTAMLSLQFAQVQWMKQRTGEHPVLLLDEVLAELDPSRREDLLRRVGESQQAILTATDLEMFTKGFRTNATIWQIRAGTISGFSQTS